MTDTNIPVTITTDDEPKPYAWSITDRGGGSVLVEVGDAFEPNAAWGSGDAAMLQQIGMGMVVKGLQFLGLDHDERRAIAALALKLGSDVSVDLDDDPDET